MSEEKKENIPETETETEKAEPKKEAKAKKPKANAEVEKLKAEVEAQKELLMRTAAEFDNFKKRTEREKIKTAEYSKANILKQLLPVIDNAERALAVDPASADYAKGVELIVKQLMGLIDTFGMVELAEVGDTFNPEIHEAVMHVEDPEKGENEIVTVLQQGYKLGDTVIRPAMVQVAN
ncbi:MAG: nucleotide exchange factor GrpE [Clostridia bacterium]|nr:nucleotide exchange factor GrpE [Clostridia bacterium]MBQ9920104.1 nucleotide exchange factor GrpE [Clostridia bacterium]